MGLSITSEFFRGARVIAGRGSTNLVDGAVQLTLRNTRRYGGYIIHLGMVLVFVGISGQAFNQDIQSDMGVGSKISIGPYTLVCQNFDQVANQNFQSDRATLEVFRNGKSEMMMYPERRFFLASQVTETMVAIRSSALRDLYVVYAGRNPDTGRPVIHAYLNPLVKWIWFGGADRSPGDAAGDGSQSAAGDRIASSAGNFARDASRRAGFGARQGA